MARRRWVGSAAVLLAAASFAVAGPPPAAAGPGPDRPDVNDDGFADLVVGIPFEDSGAVADGAGQVLFGDADGLLPRDQVLSQDGPGPVPQDHDRFGAAVATGDFDDDGFDDLAVGIPGDSGAQTADGFEVQADASVTNPPSPPFDPTPRPGLVEIWYGSGDGVDAGDGPLDQGEGVPGHPEAGDAFGAALAAGDFDGDGFDDLAVGSPGEALSSEIDAGAVHVFWGGPAGLTRAGSRMLTQGPVLGGVAEADDRFGGALAAGALDADGRADLVVGAPTEDLQARDYDAGAAFAVTGPADRVFDDRAIVLHQDTPGVVGSAEVLDRFGSALAIGDVDDDGDGDLAVGVPGESLAVHQDVGAVHVLLGSPSGITTAGPVAWEGRGVGGEIYPEEHFGAAVAFGDFDLDGADDLAIGVPGERVGSIEQTGAVYVIPGTSADPTEPGTIWTQGAVGGRSEAGDHFGSALATADYTGDGTPDLAIGVSGEGVGDVQQAGAVVVVRGGPGGLTAAGDVLIHQGSAGVKGNPESADRFGMVLG